MPLFSIANALFKSNKFAITDFPIAICQTQSKTRLSVSLSARHASSTQTYCCQMLSLDFIRGARFLKRILNFSLPFLLRISIKPKKKLCFDEMN